MWLSSPYTTLHRHIGCLVFRYSQPAETSDPRSLIDTTLASAPAADMAITDFKKEAAAQTPAHNGATEDGWDEARLQSALERLQEMHIQVRRLRDAIPSLVRPIHSSTSSASSPETLYADFKTAATGSVDGVKRLRALLRDPDGREVLAHARALKDKAGGAVEGWLVEQHENWLDEPAVRSARELKTEDDLEGGFSVPEPRRQEDIKGIVEAFKENHPEIEIKQWDVLNQILFSLPSPAKVTFTISWKPNAGADMVYDVSTKGPTKLHSSINEGLARRSNKDDLNWTLELLADFINIKQQRCHVCNKLLDEENGFATVKVARLSGEGGSDETQWDSYHVGCAER